MQLIDCVVISVTVVLTDYKLWLQQRVGAMLIFSVIDCWRCLEAMLVFSA